jgi:hypothetical protein
MTNRGLLLTLTEPPPGMEEEFNAWYDEEHLPERLAIPGFRSARRWVADVPPGQGKYLATYELDSPAVLSSPAYLSFFEKPTPWSRRCLGKAVVFKRWACEQVEPGRADPHPAARALLLNAEIAGALRVRRFAAASGEQIVLCELSDPAVEPSPGLVYRLYGA